MKIIVMTPAVPAEGQAGFQVLAFHRVVHLARRHQVEVVVVGNCIDQEAAALCSMNKNISVRVFTPNIVERFFNVIKSIFRSTPFQVALFRCNKAKKYLEYGLGERSIGAVYCITFRVLENIPKLDVPIIVEFVDSMGLNFERRAEDSALLRGLYKREACAAAKYERECVQFADYGFVVSGIDKEYIGDAKLHILPLGVDNTIFRDRGKKQKPSVEFEYDLIFTGNMHYKPNRDAVLWFYNNCWRQLRSRFPNLIWAIVGSSPSSEIKSLDSVKGISVTGRVESIADSLSASRIAIAPMVSGSGMQFKVLEAMSCGMPVVVSSIGRGDIKAVSGRDLLIADDSMEFVDIISELINDEKKRAKIGQSACEYVDKNHSWSAINQKFSEACEL